jgi:hypothetical protein
MQITQARQTRQERVAQTRSGWWLVPSFLCGAAIWGGILVALVG